MSTTIEARDAFVAHLERLRDRQDRAALARLRRALGKPPGTVADVHPLVQPWLPRSLSVWHEDWCYLVASLFAAHPESGGTGNLGHAFARLAAGRESGSVEKRFVALLDADAEDVPAHLRHAVSLLAADGVPVNWRQLLADLSRWGHPGRVVQRAWARAFWAAPDAPVPPPNPSPS
jgi:CRISPR system Cascade subunit CasB